MANIDAIRNESIALRLRGGAVVPELTIFVDDYTSERHRQPLEHSEYPVESGALITDHLVARPLELELTGIVSDALRARHTEGSTPLEVRGSAAWQRIRDLAHETRPLAEVFTGAGTYRNLALVDAEARVRSDTGKTLEFTLRFREVQEVEIRQEQPTASTVVAEKRGFLMPNVAQSWEEMLELQSIRDAEDAAGSLDGLPPPLLPSGFTSNLDLEGWLDLTATDQSAERREPTPEGEPLTDDDATIIATANLLRFYLEQEYPGRSLSSLTASEVLIPQVAGIYRLRIPLRNTASSNLILTLGGQSLILQIRRSGTSWQARITWQNPPDQPFRRGRGARGLAGALAPEPVSTGTINITPYANLASRLTARGFRGSVRAMPGPTSAGRASDIGIQPWGRSHDLFYYPAVSQAALEQVL